MRVLWSAGRLSEKVRNQFSPGNGDRISRLGASTKWGPPAEWATIHQKQ